MLGFLSSGYSRMKTKKKKKKKQDDLLRFFLLWTIRRAKNIYDVLYMKKN